MKQYITREINSHHFVVDEIIAGCHPKVTAHFKYNLSTHTYHLFFEQHVVDAGFRNGDLWFWDNMLCDFNRTH